MKRLSRKYGFILVLSLIFVLVTTVAGFANDGSTKITILSSSDLHGRLYPHDYAIDAVSETVGISKIATLVKAERALNPNLILMDVGDTVQGNSAELFNSLPVHPMVEAMNFLDYDIWTLGNHEFNFPKSFAERNIAAFEGTVLAANIYNKDGSRFVNPYKIIEKDGVRIAIVGLIPPRVPIWEAGRPENFEGLTFTDPLEETKKVIKELEGQYDVLVGAFHLGPTEEYDFKASESIAKACPEFTVIFGGHDHSLFHEKVVNGVKLVMPGRWGQALAKAEIEMVKADGKWTVKSAITSNIAVNKDVAADKAVLDKFADVHKKSVEDANIVIGKIAADFIKAVDFITGGSRVTTMPTAQLFDNAVIDLINEVQMYYAKADVSSAALFSNNSNLVAGDFKKKDVVNIYMYDNSLMGVNITGENLKKYMEWSAGYYNTFNSGDLTVSFNEKVRGYNYDMFSGVTYDIDLSKPTGERIKNVMFNGKPLDDKAVYKLAVNNYRFGTLTSLGLVKNEDKYFDAAEATAGAGYIRDYIKEYTQTVKNGILEPTVDNNWKLVGVSLNHPHMASLRLLLSTGALKIPTSEDGRTLNVKALNLNELIAQGILSDAYVVKEGDVLWKIGRKFGFTWKELAEYNGIVKPNLIFPGNKIFIPLKRIDVLSTNDFHGNLEGSSSNPGAAKLAAYINYYRAENPNGTFVLDAGDALQGTPISNIHRGKPVVETMKAMGYDAMTVGNHEFDWGINEALESLKLGNFPFLAANIYENGKPVNWAKPYTIIEKNGVKVGIIGLATPLTTSAAHANYVGGFEFKDPVEIANALIPQVRKAGAQVIVLLTHIPGYQDAKTLELTGDLATLAKGVTGADVVIGGHSHQNVSGILNNAVVMESNYNGRNLSRAVVILNPVTGKVVGKAANNIDVRNGKLDVKPVAEVQAIVDRYNADLKPVFDVVIGKTNVDLVRNGKAESNIGNWVADAMRAKAGVQIAMQNAGGVRIDMPTGNITVGNIFSLMPFDNVIVTSEMTGAQIKALLEQSVHSKGIGVMQISGVKFTYDSTKADGEKVLTMSLVDGTAIELDKKYTICTNDFLATGGDNFATFKEVKWVDTYILVRDVLMDDVKAKKELAPVIDGRTVDINTPVSYLDNKLAA